MKRIFDVTLSLCGLFILSPFLVAVAWLIKREDGGPIFFRGERMGLHGVPFRIFKFRTMIVNADKFGPSSTSSRDQRITRIGLFLRRYKLDEVPQLLNVLQGEMSIVGPRPEVRRFTDMYTGLERSILSARPGITDWASIWNCDEGTVLAGAADPDEAYLKLIRPTKIKLQLKYVLERSFWTDMKIIFLTFLALVRPGSAAVKEIRQQPCRHIPI